MLDSVKLFQITLVGWLILQRLLGYLISKFVMEPPIRIELITPW